jgi:hypothetical protein
VQGLEFFNVLIELFLFLLHTMVVHFVEVTLLSEFVPSVLGLLGHDARLVELGTEMVNLLLELLIADVDVRHIGGYDRLPFLVQFIILLLENFERLCHLVLDEIVAEKVVHHFETLDRLTLDFNYLFGFLYFLEVLF